ncbi:MAG: inorganic phosphate transporter [Deltaproteobacteria bacterium]|nr:inorganic phosphate transporter [Deltaproteobacteria bacterium]
MSTLLVVFIAVALLFDFLNGFHDSSNIVSTMIASRALSPRQALAITALAEFVGPFMFGVAVATTVGAGVLKLPADHAQALPIVLAAMASAVGWNLVTWYFGIPSSSSHALVGGLLGAGIADAAWRQLGVGMSSVNDIRAVFEVVQPSGMGRVAMALFVSPPLGFAAGYLLVSLIRLLARRASPAINGFFKRGQIVTALGLALSHGSNDAQKTMGVITLALVASGVLSEFRVPWWVVGLSAAAIALGTAVGGWRLIRTLGGGLFKIRPLHGFTTQMGSASVILVAGLLGGPVSTTQVVASAIMGSGSAERFSKVRWGVGKQIVLAWLITIPFTALVAGLAWTILRRFT